QTWSVAGGIKIHQSGRAGDFPGNAKRSDPESVQRRVYRSRNVAKTQSGVLSSKQNSSVAGFPRRAPLFSGSGNVNSSRSQYVGNCRQKNGNVYCAVLLG